MESQTILQKNISTIQGCHQDTIFYLFFIDKSGTEKVDGRKLKRASMSEASGFSGGL